MGSTSRNCGDNTNLFLLLFDLLEIRFFSLMSLDPRSKVHNWWEGISQYYKCGALLQAATCNGEGGPLLFCLETPLFPTYFKYGQRRVAWSQW